jgi:hypothetical protein
MLYCGVFAQSKNCGGTKTAVAMQCPHATIDVTIRDVTRTAVAMEQSSKRVSGEMNTRSNR